MYYEASDFLATADPDTLCQIARTRELTREYFHCSYHDAQKNAPFYRSCSAESVKMSASTRRFTATTEKIFFWETT